jgi:LPS sulfotransferase NodH
MKQFNIITAGRTGSTFLTNVLNKHPQICCAGELFHPRRTELSEDRFKDPHGFLNFVAQNSKSIGKNIFGSKFIVERDDEIIKQMLSNPNNINVYLFRRNKLQQAVSSFLADRAGDWQNYTDKLNKEFEIPLDNLQKRIDRYVKRDELIKTFMQLSDNPYPIYYEDFSLTNFNKLFTFLGANTVVNVNFGEGPHRNKVYHLIKNKEELIKTFGYNL